MTVVDHRVKTVVDHRVKTVVDHRIKGGLYLKPSETTKILSTYLSCHNFFPLSSVQIIIVPACCLLCVL